MTKQEDFCLICGDPFVRVEHLPPQDIYRIDCRRCGRFEMISPEFLPKSNTGDLLSWPLISHSLRLMQRSNSWPLLSLDLYEKIVADKKLPLPPEQGHNLILLVGDHTKDADPTRKLSTGDALLPAIIGAIDQDAVEAIIWEMRELSYLKIPERVADNSLQLTFKGWQRYKELLHSQTDGSFAFMAMPFGDERLDDIFRDYLKPAVAQTGFDLRRMDEAPPAGIIDVQMEVEIRRSQFLIAELTDDNNGVYWESGFAEGLGKPVIYTCERSYHEGSDGTHFDTSHRHTVIWSEDDIDQAMSDLKNTIRATLPEAAKMSDE